MVLFMVKKKYVDYGVTAEKFVETWQACSSADEVAKKLDMPKAIVHARASAYRRRGVKLKKMGRPTKGKLDIEALNRLIDKKYDKKKGER
jgi:transposase